MNDMIATNHQPANHSLLLTMVYLDMLTITMNHSTIIVIVHAGPLIAIGYSN